MKKLLVIVTALLTLSLFSLSAFAFDMQESILINTYSWGSVTTGLYANRQYNTHEYSRTQIPAIQSGTNDVNYGYYLFDMPFAFKRGTDTNTTVRYLNGWTRFNVPITIECANNGIWTMRADMFTIENYNSESYAYIESVQFVDSYVGSTSGRAYVKYNVQISLFCNNVDIQRGQALFDLKSTVTVLRTGTLPSDGIDTNVSTATGVINNLSCTSSPSTQGLGDVIANSIKNTLDFDIDLIEDILMDIQGSDYGTYQLILNRLPNLSEIFERQYTQLQTIINKLTQVQNGIVDLNSTEVDILYSLRRFINAMAGVEYDNPNLSESLYNRWVNIFQDALNTVFDNLEHPDTAFTNDQLELLRQKQNSLNNLENEILLRFDTADDRVVLPELSMPVLNGVNFVSSTLTTIHDSLPTQLIIVVAVLLILVVIRVLLGR